MKLAHSLKQLFYYPSKGISPSDSLHGPVLVTAISASSCSWCLFACVLSCLGLCTGPCLWKNTGGTVENLDEGARSTESPGPVSTRSMAGFFFFLDHPKLMSLGCRAEIGKAGCSLSGLGGGHGSRS